MVSKAREDLPEPERPVITVTLSWGILRFMFLRLFCLAPSMISSEFMGEFIFNMKGSSLSLYKFTIEMLNLYDERRG